MKLKTTMPWFRLYAEMINDRKLRLAAKDSGIPFPELVGIFVCLLCIANDSPVRGRLLVTENRFYKIEDLVYELGIEENRLKLALEYLMNYNMIGQNEEYGDYYIKNWDKRQYESDNSTERVKKYREKQELKRDGNVSETSSESDTDTESYTDKEDDDGEVFKSFNNNISMLTPIIADALKADITEYGKDWVLEAITTGAQNNGRSLSYVEKILENRKKGITPGKNSKSHKNHDPHEGRTQEERNRYKEYLQQ